MRRPRRAPALALTAGVLIVLAAMPATAAKDDLDLVSRASGPTGVGGNGGSFVADISDDGRYVVFQSDADNLVSDDTNGFSDVFLRDLETNTTTLLSRADGAGGQISDSTSFDPSISADGRHVAFRSFASNISNEDTDSTFDVYVRDLETETITLASRETGAGSDGADENSLDPVISADGRHVAFRSEANNLSGEDDDDVQDIYVRDLDDDTTTLVSRADTGTGMSGDANSLDPALSADGRHVAFHSFADNLSNEDDDNFSNVFLRDVQAATTTLVSRATGVVGDAGDEDSSGAAVSADGRLVAFGSAADNLSPEDDDSLDVFVRDVHAGTTTFVSRATGADGVAGDRPSNIPDISANGRYVAFRSQAETLSAEDAPGTVDIYVRDLQANTTTLASRESGPTGAAGDASSENPAITNEGRFVAFESQADNLSAADDDMWTDVYRRDVLGPPPPTPSPPPAPPPPPPGPPAPPPPPGLPGAPTSANPVCNPVPERGESKKGTIRYTRTALKIQQNIDSAVIRRLNAANVWIGAGIVPSDLCAGAFGPGAFQAGISWAGGAPHDASPPAPRDPEIVKKPGTGTITRSPRQLAINENISRALRARAVATVKRIDALTGGNLAPGAVLSGRAVWPGLMAVGPKLPSADAPPAELEIGRLPRKIPIRPNAITVKKQQERSQGSIILANRALDAITGGLTETNFVPGSIGSGRI